MLAAPVIIAVGAVVCPALALGRGHRGVEATEAAPAGQVHARRGVLDIRRQGMALLALMKAFMHLVNSCDCISLSQLQNKNHTVGERVATFVYYHREKTLLIYMHDMTEAHTSFTVLQREDAICGE